MNTHRTHRGASELGALWFLAPLVAILVALLLIAVIGAQPAGSAQPPGDAKAQPAPAAPYVSSDPSLPAAASVLTGPQTEPYEHVEAF